MFLDDELNKIFDEGGFTPEVTTKLLRACINRLPSREETAKMAPSVFLTRLKQIDNAWRMFCKKHAEYNANGWRNWVLRSDTTGKFKKALNW